MTVPSSNKMRIHCCSLVLSWILYKILLDEKKRIRLIYFYLRRFFLGSPFADFIHINSIDSSRMSRNFVFNVLRHMLMHTQVCGSFKLSHSFQVCRAHTAFVFSHFVFCLFRRTDNSDAFHELNTYNISNLKNSVRDHHFVSCFILHRINECAFDSHNQKAMEYLPIITECVFWLWCKINIIINIAHTALCVNYKIDRKHDANLK